MAYRPPTPGVLFENKYRLAERIGGGGMGSVFRAENVLAGREVAIKFLRGELAENAELAQRFFQEAQAVNRIRHPNIVEVLDAGVGEMGPFIAMEYLEGESVGACLLRLGRFDLETSVGVVIPVLEALDAAHRVGIIHRDLKPENVFLAYDAKLGTAVVRLLDFGIAKILDASEPSPRTRTGVVFGTPDYLSPEQASGDVPLDGRSDLFAVGVLLYELLTGARPFRAPTAVATAFRVVHAEAPTLSAAGVFADPRVEGILQRLLQKDPARRFATAPDVIRELERLVPDPGRRVAALGRAIQVTKRSVAHALAADRAASARDSSPAAVSPSRPAPVSRPSPESARAPYVAEGAAPASPQTVSTTRSHEAAHAIGVQAASSSRAHDAFPASAPAVSPRAVEAPASGPSPKPKWAPPARLPDLIDAPTMVTPRTASPRASPQHFNGRFQVRGPVLRSVDRGVVDVFGAKARDEVVDQMPAAFAAELRNDSINALVAYDLQALDGYMDACTRVVLHDLGLWRELGRLAVDGELQQVVRTLLRPATDLSSVVRRGVSVWARLFTFGQWRVSTSPAGKVSLRMSEFEPVSQPIRLWMVGVIEQTARRAMGAEVRLVITDGETGFAPELVCEIG